MFVPMFPHIFHIPSLKRQFNQITQTIIADKPDNAGA